MKITKNFYKCLFVFAIFISLLLLIKLISCADKKENFENKSKFIDRIVFPKLNNQTKESSEFDNGEFVLFRETIPANTDQVTFYLSSNYEFIEKNSDTSTQTGDMDNMFFTFKACIIKNNNIGTKTIKSVKKISKNNTNLQSSFEFINLQATLPADLKSDDLVDVIIILDINNIINDYKLRFDNFNIEYEIEADIISRTSGNYKQESNIIYFKNIIKDNNNDNLNNILNNNSNSGSKTNLHQITLNDNYFISQIYLSNLFLNKYDLIIGIKNSKLNELTYIDLTDNINKNKIMRINRNSEKYISSFKATFITSNNGIFINNIRDMFSNEILGNEIQIYTKKSLADADILVTGYLGSERYDYKKIIQEELITVDKEDIHYLNTTVNEANITPHKDNFNIKYISFNYNNQNSTNTNNNQDIPNDVKIKFRNSYSNNIMTYNGYGDDYQFIITQDSNNKAYIYLTRGLVASEIEIINSKNGSKINSDISIDYYGDKSTSSDINRFILENNVSDIKGSINPDLICPSIKTLMNDTLDAELIVEAIDYQDKINTERIKLSSNKENLLTLLEQAEDIKKLETMVNKIKSISKDNEEHVSVLNSLQFKKNMEDYQVLKEFLDKRINTRKKNTANIDVNVFSSELTNALNDAASKSETFLNL